MRTGKGHRKLATMRAEKGFVLPASVAILLVITLLGAAAVSVSVSASKSTTRDEHSKAALEEAEAGLRVATYRLNVLGPASEECLAGTTLVTPTSEATQCASAEESLGNGGSYQFWNTTELKKGGGCVGIIMTDQSLQQSKGEGVEQRCVTSVGTVNGVTARVEARVSSFSAKPVFPIAAMIAKEKLMMEGNSLLDGAVASNGKIVSSGSASQEGGCILGPSGSFEGVKSTCEAVSQRTPEEGKFVVASIQPGTSAEPAPAPQKCEEQAEPKYNCNFLIENGITNAEAGKEVKTPADGVSSTGNGKVQVKYEKTYREMSMNSGSWTLNGYLYNFCNFSATGNSAITVNPGIRAVIFIDSPEDSKSNCPAGSGKFEFTGSVNNPSGDPTALQIYVYGKGPVTYTGNANTSFVLDAPNAPVKLTGNGTLTGGIIGNEITTSGSFHFIWDKEVEKLKAGLAGATTSYYRTAWAQCTPTVTASAPMTGC